MALPSLALGLLALVKIVLFRAQATGVPPVTPPPSWDNPTLASSTSSPRSFGLQTAGPLTRRVHSTPEAADLSGHAPSSLQPVTPVVKAYDDSVADDPEALMLEQGSVPHASPRQRSRAAAVRGALAMWRLSKALAELPIKALDWALFPDATLVQGATAEPLAMQQAGAGSAAQARSTVLTASQTTTGADALMPGPALDPATAPFTCFPPTLQAESAATSPMLSQEAAPGGVPAATDAAAGPLEVAKGAAAAAADQALHTVHALGQAAGGAAASVREALSWYGHGPSGGAQSSTPQFVARHGGATAAIFSVALLSWAAAWGLALTGRAVMSVLAKAKGRGKGPAGSKATSPKDYFGPFYNIAAAMATEAPLRQQRAAFPTCLDLANVPHCVPATSVATPPPPLSPAAAAAPASKTPLPPAADAGASAATTHDTSAASSAMSPPPPLSAEQVSNAPLATMPITPDPAASSQASSATAARDVSPKLCPAPPQTTASSGDELSLERLSALTRRLPPPPSRNGWSSSAAAAAGLRPNPLVLPESPLEGKQGAAPAGGPSPSAGAPATGPEEDAVDPLMRTLRGLAGGRSKRHRLTWSGQSRDGAGREPSEVLWRLQQDLRLAEMSRRHPGGVTCHPYSPSRSKAASAAAAPSAPPAPTPAPAPADVAPPADTQQPWTMPQMRALLRAQADPGHGVGEGSLPQRLRATSERMASMEWQERLMNSLFEEKLQAARMLHERTLARMAAERRTRSAGSSSVAEPAPEGSGSGVQPAAAADAQSGGEAPAGRGAQEDGGSEDACGGGPARTALEQAIRAHRAVRARQVARGVRTSAMPAEGGAAEEVPPTTNSEMAAAATSEVPAVAEAPAPRSPKFTAPEPAIDPASEGEIWQMGPACELAVPLAWPLAVPMAVPLPPAQPLPLGVIIPGEEQPPSAPAAVALSVDPAPAAEPGSARPPTAPEEQAADAVCDGYIWQMGPQPAPKAVATPADSAPQAVAASAAAPAEAPAPPSPRFTVPEPAIDPSTEGEIWQMGPACELAVPLAWPLAVPMAVPLPPAQPLPLGVIMPGEEQHPSAPAATSAAGDPAAVSAEDADNEAAAIPPAADAPPAGASSEEVKEGAPHEGMAPCAALTAEDGSATGEAVASDGCASAEASAGAGPEVGPEAAGGGATGGYIRSTMETPGLRISTTISQPGTSLLFQYNPATQATTVALRPAAAAPIPSTEEPAPPASANAPASCASAGGASEAATASPSSSLSSPRMRIDGYSFDGLPWCILGQEAEEQGQGGAMPAPLTAAVMDTPEPGAPAVATEQQQLDKAPQQEELPRLHAVQQLLPVTSPVPAPSQAEGDASGEPAAATAGGCSAAEPAAAAAAGGDAPAPAGDSVALARAQERGVVLHRATRSGLPVGPRAYRTATVQGRRVQRPVPERHPAHHDAAGRQTPPLTRGSLFGQTVTVTIEQAGVADTAVEVTLAAAETPQPQLPPAAAPAAALAPPVATEPPTAAVPAKATPLDFTCDNDAAREPDTAPVPAAAADAADAAAGAAPEANPDAPYCLWRRSRGWDFYGGQYNGMVASKLAPWPMPSSSADGSNADADAEAAPGASSGGPGDRDRDGELTQAHVGTGGKVPAGFLAPSLNFLADRACAEEDVVWALAGAVPKLVQPETRSTPAEAAAVVPAATKNPMASAEALVKHATAAAATAADAARLKGAVAAAGAKATAAAAVEAAAAAGAAAAGSFYGQRPEVMFSEGPAAKDEERPAELAGPGADIGVAAMAAGVAMADAMPTAKATPEVPMQQEEDAEDGFLALPPAGVQAAFNLRAAEPADAPTAAAAASVPLTSEPPSAPGSQEESRHVQHQAATALLADMWKVHQDLATASARDIAAAVAVPAPSSVDAAFAADLARALLAAPAQQQEVGSVVRDQVAEALSVLDAHLLMEGAQLTAKPQRHFEPATAAPSSTSTGPATPVAPATEPPTAAPAPAPQLPRVSAANDRVAEALSLLDDSLWWQQQLGSRRREAEAAPASPWAMPQLEESSEEEVREAAVLGAMASGMDMPSATAAVAARAGAASGAATVAQQTVPAVGGGAATAAAAGVLTAAMLAAHDAEQQALAEPDREDAISWDEDRRRHDELMRAVELWMEDADEALAADYEYEEIVQQQQGGGPSADPRAVNSSLVVAAAFAAGMGGAFDDDEQDASASGKAVAGQEALGLGQELELEQLLAEVDVMHAGISSDEEEGGAASTDQGGGASAGAAKPWWLEMSWDEEEDEVEEEEEGVLGEGEAEQGGGEDDDDDDNDGYDFEDPGEELEFEEEEVAEGEGEGSAFEWPEDAGAVEEECDVWPEEEDGFEYW